MRTCTEIPDRRGHPAHQNNEVNGFHGSTSQADSFDGPGK